MLIGYARTSTANQIAGLEAQVRELNKLGVERIFQEQVSSVKERDQLDAALDFVREGDTFVVTKLDRLARSSRHLHAIVASLEAKHVGLRILDFGGGQVDTSSANGKLMLNMFSAMAEFERDLMLERQREGIAKAKAEGKYKGRQPTARAKAKEITELRAQKFGASEIAKQLSISRASVYRVLSDPTLN